MAAAAVKEKEEEEEEEERRRRGGGTHTQIDTRRVCVCASASSGGVLKCTL